MVLVPGDEALRQPPSPFSLFDHPSGCRPLGDPSLHPPWRDAPVGGSWGQGVWPHRPPAPPPAPPRAPAHLPEKSKPLTPPAGQPLIVRPPGCIFLDTDEPLSPGTQPESELNSRRIGSPPHQSAGGHSAGEEGGRVGWAVQESWPPRAVSVVFCDHKSPRRG